MKYVWINELLTESGIADGNFQEFNVCCGEGRKSFSFLRAQIEGKLLYTSDAGVYIDDKKHIDKCMSIIREAQQKHIDLLLFPEYAIPYTVIEAICKDSNLWPEERKLWVMPCCGAKNNYFMYIIDKINNMKNVKVLGDGAETKNIDFREFVNALFYIFRIENELILVPQLKTYCMRDIDYECEEVGLSLGNRIFVFGKRSETILLSLICADVMNEAISWRDIQELGSNCIVLNPQLNSNPRNQIFRRLRQSFFDRSIEGVLITCNWAAPTTIKSAESRGHTVEISLAWSCIYYKEGKDFETRKWIDNIVKVLNMYEQKGLYVGILKNYKTEVWYVDNQEVIHIVNIAKVRIKSAGILQHKFNIGFPIKYVYDHGGLVEEVEGTFSFLNEVNNTAVKFYNIFERLAKEEFKTYAFPFLETERRKIDRFFDLVNGNVNWDYLIIDDNEEVRRYTLVLTEDEGMIRNKAFSHYLYLRQALIEGKLPEYLKRSFEKAHILSWNEEVEYSNLYERENDIPKLEGKSVYTSFVETEDAAKELLVRMRNKDLNKLREWDMCIFTQSDLLSGKIITYPKLNTDIASGTQILSSVDITGGDIND